MFAEDRERERRSRIYGTPEFKKRYQQYIRSKEWKALRLQVIQRCGGLCERCREKPKRLEIHHLTYDRFGDELLTDLQALCFGRCHGEADKERERSVANRREERGENARIEAARDTYFTKIYGGDWERHWLSDPERMDRQFDDWLERKEMADDGRSDYYGR